MSLLARRRDPETSHAAGESTAVTVIQRRVLEIIIDNSPLPDHLIAAAYRMRWGHTATDQSLRTRRKELERLGLVEWSGLYGLTPSGRRTREWTIPDMHVSALDRMDGAPWIS